ncbi:hypothetical protein ACJX0J_019545, partial [Zea mays]
WFDANSFPYEIWLSDVCLWLRMPKTISTLVLELKKSRRNLLYKRRRKSHLGTPFYFWHAAGKELSEEKVGELQRYAEGMGSKRDILG